MRVNNLPKAKDVIIRLSTDESRSREELYDIYYQISTAIFTYRLANKLTQKQLGERLGISQPMVAKLESGDYNYTVEQLWKIAKKLGFEFTIRFGEKLPATESMAEWEYLDEMTPDTGCLAVSA